MKNEDTVGLPSNSIILSFMYACCSYSYTQLFYLVGTCLNNLSQFTPEDPSALNISDVSLLIQMNGSACQLIIKLCRVHIMTHAFEVGVLHQRHI